MFREAKEARSVMQVSEWEIIEPTEANGYCIFAPTLEHDQLVFFHATPRKFLYAILEQGFSSAARLGTGKLESVSYAKNSSSCLAHTGNDIQEDYVVFAVKFQSLDGAVVNNTDIHVYRQDVQPEILGYCILKKGFAAH